MKPFAFLLVAMMLAAPAATAGAAQPSAPAPAAAAESLPRIAELLANVRRAVRYDRLRKFPNGFAVSERQAGASDAPFVLRFGTRAGELRRGSDFGFDGSRAWQHDGRRGIAVPSPLRQREKAAWPLWVRGHWWLSPSSGFSARVVPEASSERELAVALALPDSVVGATVYVDRRTWLPDRIVVPYERGPFTEKYRDYRAVDGVMMPFEVESVYRDTSVRRVVSVAPIASRGDFSWPALPADHRFDRARLALLETRQGVPFPGGTPGHVYVRASVDESRTGWWHFDSGSDSMIVDEAVADAMKMEVIGTHRSMGADGNVREGTWRRARSFRLGRLRIENLVFRAMDLSANNAPPGERRMGTIGYDVFARAVVEYGDGGRRVRICDPAAYRLPSRATWRRLDYIDSTPAARGVADGLLGLFQLDTGSAGSVDFTRHFHERNRMLAGRETRQHRVLGSGGDFSVEVGRLDRFDFAGEAWRGLEVAFRTGGISREGSAGTIGREVLARFNLVFDYPNHRIAFLPPDASGMCR